MSEVPRNVAQAVRFASFWVRGLTDDWVIVKEEILNELANADRSLFSKRDPRTKSSVLNPMEEAIVEMWRSLTGVTLQVRTYRERRGTRWWRPTPEAP